MAGREWFGAVFQEPFNSSTRRSFSKTTQRQFSGEPVGAKPVSLASELEYHLLAKDLKLIKPKDHAELSQRATELRRMLTARLHKLNDER